MQYLYYPGCSLEGTAKEYDASTRALMAALGVELIDVTDWTCCGATAADSLSSLLSLSLPARNLALAQRQHPNLDILVPCSACYLNLKKVEYKCQKQPELLQTLNNVLAVENLKLQTAFRVRHLLDVLAHDITPTRLADKVTCTLSGLVIAPYYGCQCLRPYALFDNPEDPHSMDGVINSTGARIFNWSMGAKCCGASHMTTKMAVAFELTGAILHAARKADAIATVCPMCQINLEGYQKQISRATGSAIDLTIVYLPQILGLCLGLDEKALQLKLNLSVTETFLNKLAGCRQASPCTA